MSADSFVVFYGVLRRLADSAEIELCESRQHPWIVAARNAGLQHYWGTFGLDGDHILLVGRRLGVFGAEGDTELQLCDSELQSISLETKERLERAGIAETPKLLIQYEPDS